MFAKMMTRCAVVAGLFALTLLPLAPSQSRADNDPIYVQKITVVNESFFIMKSWVDWNQGRKIVPSDNTDYYPVGQQRTIDLADYDLPEGVDIWPGVQAWAGKGEDGPRVLKYSPNGQTATFYVHGTTLNFSIDGP